MYRLFVFLLAGLVSNVVVLCQENLEDESLTELIETEGDSQLWLEEESPPWFIDLFFMCVITFVHAWYAYHFTDYALRNLHPRQSDEVCCYLNQKKKKKGKTKTQTTNTTQKNKPKPQ